MDNLQTSVPGYRDRVAHIALNSQEGGLNLNMPLEVQTALAEYGTEAAQRIIDHFIKGVDHDRPVRTTWDNHRWTRYRSTMALIGNFLSQFSNSIAKPELTDRSYSELIRRLKTEEPRSYQLSAQQREAAERLTERLAELGTEIDGLMRDGQPKPDPTLRVRPNF
jgi:hypothetical protein